MKNNKAITISLLIIVIFICGVVLRLAKPVLFPFFIAIFISYILFPILDFLKKNKIPNALSIIFILIVAFFIFYLLGALFYSSGKAFAAELPKYGQKVGSILSLIQEKFKLTSTQWQLVNWVEQIDLDKIASFILSSLGPFFAFIKNLFLIFIFLIFILAEREIIEKKISKSFSGSQSKRIVDVIQKINNQIQKYLAIKTVVSFITGVFVTIVLLLFGVDFAVVFGFFTFLLNYIPNIGSIIATAFPVTIAVFQFETLWPALWILIIIIAIQMIMGNFIEPRVMGKGLDLSPLVVLLSLFFWGWLWGLPGMILAVPITAIIKIVCANFPSLRPLALLMSR
ncbi:MAG: AI-2E family transporter [Candidatus Aminicenantes bacterium]|nr:AI-2E family transporter [Candidatus Aminicenantes bacterium]